LIGNSLDSGKIRQKIVDPLPDNSDTIDVVDRHSTLKSQADEGRKRKAFDNPNQRHCQKKTGSLRRRADAVQFSEP